MPYIISERSLPINLSSDLCNTTLTAADFFGNRTEEKWVPNFPS